MGNAGVLTVKTKRLIMNDGAQISSTTRGNGNGGNLFINASESVELLGLAEDGFSSRIFSQVNRGGVGNSGTLTIDTRNLILRDGAQIGSGTFGQGNGNDLTINASESVELSGVDIDGIGSAISSQTSIDAIGNAGNLTIETVKLSLNNDAFITSSTNNIGNSGNLKIQASDSVVVDNGSFIAARASEGGRAGNLDIVTNKLIVDNLAELRVSGKGQFPASSLTVNANSILLDNQGSINAVAATGTEGNISLTSQDVVQYLACSTHWKALPLSHNVAPTSAEGGEAQEHGGSCLRARVSSEWHRLGRAVLTRIARGM